MHQNARHPSRGRPRPLRRLATRVAALLTLVGAFLVPGQAASAATVASVDPTDVYQAHWQGWGTSLAWWADVIGGWSATNRNAVADEVFGSSGLAMNIARYNIGGSSPTSTGMRAGAAVRSYVNADGTYDWSRDANQRTILQAAKDRGADVFEGFSNSPPWWMTNSGQTSGASDCGNNLKADQYDAFAAYLAEVTKHFRDSWGTTFSTVSPVNEPDGTWWCAGGGQEGSAWSESQQASIVTKLGQQLDARGLTLTGVSAPDSNGVTAAKNAVTSFDATARGHLEQVNTHTYNNSGLASLRDTTAGLGKNLWVSEYGCCGGAHDHDSIGTGLSLADRITGDLNELRPSAWVYWQAVEDEGAAARDPHNWGLIHAPFTGSTETYTRTKQFYAMANYSRYIRAGYQIISSGDQDTVAAFNPATNTLVLVTHNDTGSDRAVDYDLTRFSGVSGSARPYRTSASQNLAQLGDIGVTNKRFSATVPANSITTYVVGGVSYGGATTPINDSTTGTGTSQFNYGTGWSYAGQSGAHQNDNHYTTTAGATVTIPFTGTQIELYGARAANHGIAAVSIDNGTEMGVDYYAPTRVDNVRLWTSPKLTPGAHTLKIRVTGTRNPAATNTYVTVDRVDVVRTTTNVNDNTTGTGTNQVNYQGTWGYYAGQSGAYQNDNHYSTSAGATATVAFNGSQIRLYGARDPGHGIGAVSIDDGPETTVDYYAASRSDNVLLWTSPLLSNQPHTLKLRVTGTKNSSATSFYVTLDRVDIG
ncbi:glycoside hydrolase family 30 protein [Micromonospora sp. BQ11]|uniref:glycoside hydrolase family 30 protein n=1 Tax=Micromonospora sp. BQ11 TaxID=3452212 RepID=UPI003F8B5485